MCGLFGWVGKDPKKFNYDKYKILGLYNVSRGKDSCGIFMDNEIYVGATVNDKLFSDFISINNNLKPLNNAVVIGHTRQASFGNLVNAANAHPFGFTEKNSLDYTFVGAHNGTLYNHEELAKKNNIELVEETKSFTGTTTSISYRKKIDSEILLEILKNGNTDVLKEYVGAAALLFSDLKKQNTLYVWKGASKEWSSYKESSEERPLFYYIENKDSLYISSIKESLYAIGGEVDTVFTFDENFIYEIKDGDISKAKKTKIDRSDSFQKNFTTGVITTNYTANTGSTKRNYMNTHSETPNFNTVMNIYDEKVVNQSGYGKRVFFNKLSFQRNGHNITGIYTFIKGWGYYYLADKLNTAKHYLEKALNKPFVEGEFLYDYSFETHGDLSLWYVPFTKLNLNNLHFFINGVKICTYLDYSYYLDSTKIITSINQKDLSDVSLHPVKDSSKIFLSNSLANAYYRKNLFTGRFTILGAEKTYNFNKGLLIAAVENEYMSELLWEEPLPKAVEKIDFLNSFTTDESFINNLFHEELEAAVIAIHEDVELAKESEKNLDLESFFGALKNIEDNLDLLKEHKREEYFNLKSTYELLQKSYLKLATN